MTCPGITLLHGISSPSTSQRSRIRLAKEHCHQLVAYRLRLSSAVLVAILVESEFISGRIASGDAICTAGCHCDWPILIISTLLIASSFRTSDGDFLSITTITVVSCFPLALPGASLFAGQKPMPPTDIALSDRTLCLDHTQSIYCICDDLQILKNVDTPPRASTLRAFCTARLQLLPSEQQDKSDTGGRVSQLQRDMRPSIQHKEEGEMIKQWIRRRRTQVALVQTFDCQQHSSIEAPSSSSRRAINDMTLITSSSPASRELELDLLVAVKRTESVIPATTARTKHLCCVIVDGHGNQHSPINI